ncbi:hypothetical protein KKH43_00315 [Patescibacteria group bacterium]|nr:hypothetical protein [Patescibacteria group bacterium]
MAFIYIAATSLMTVGCQLLLKWRATKVNLELAGSDEKLAFLIKMIKDPLVILAFLLALGASVFWMLALSQRIELSTAYSLTSMSFIIIFISSVFLFHESISILKIIGLTSIIFGIVVLSRGL